MSTRTLLDEIEKDLDSVLVKLDDMATRTDLEEFKLQGICLFLGSSILFVTGLFCLA